MARARGAATWIVIAPPLPGDASKCGRVLSYPANVDGNRDGSTRLFGGLKSQTQEVGACAFSSNSVVRARVTAYRRRDRLALDLFDLHPPQLPAATATIAEWK